MAMQVKLSSISSTNSMQTFEYKVKFEKDDIIVKVSNLGMKHVYKADEILFTNDGETLVNCSLFLQKWNCETIAELSEKIRSIGFAIVDKKFTPVLSSQIVIPDRAR